MHTYIHTYVHPYIHTYIHTYTHTYIQEKQQQSTYKVVYASGGSMKLPPYPLASGQRLQQADILISIHPVITQSDEEVATLNRPQHIAGYSPSRFGVLSLTDRDVAHVRSYSWRRNKGISKLTWANVVPTFDVIAIATHLVEAGAFTDNLGTSTGTHISKHSPDSDVLLQITQVAALCPDMVMRLEDAEEYESWCMTAKGTQAIELINTRCEPSLLFELPPELPKLKDMTVYQLILFLEDRHGFQWLQMPKKEVDRVAITYRQVTLQRQYVGALDKQQSIPCIC